MSCTSHPAAANWRSISTRAACSGVGIRPTVIHPEQRMPNRNAFRRATSGTGRLACHRSPASIGLPNVTWHPEERLHGKGQLRRQGVARVSLRHLPCQRDPMPAHAPVAGAADVPDAPASGLPPQPDGCALDAALVPHARAEQAGLVVPAIVGIGIDAMPQRATLLEQGPRVCLGQHFGVRRTQLLHGAGPGIAFQRDPPQVFGLAC